MNVKRDIPFIDIAGAARFPEVPRSYRRTPECSTQNMSLCQACDDFYSPPRAMPTRVSGGGKYLKD